MPSGPSAQSMLAVVGDMLDGRRPPLLPVPGDDPRQCEMLTDALRVGQDIDDDVAVVVPTSGTTGTPKVRSERTIGTARNALNGSSPVSGL